VTSDQQASKALRGLQAQELRELQALQVETERLELLVLPDLKVTLELQELADM